MFRYLCVTLFSLLLFSAPLQASVVYSGSIIGQVTADVDQMDTGHNSYNSGPLNASLGGVISNTGSLSINDIGGNVAATTYYNVYADSSVSATAAYTQLSGNINMYIDGGKDPGASYGGTSSAQINYSFSIDTMYDYDFSFMFIEFANPNYVYFELVNTDAASSVFYFDAWDASDVLSSGSLIAGNYQLTLVSDINANSGGGSYPPYGFVSGGYNFTLVSAVPVPAAVWLFGSGLIGLIGVARRRRG